MGKGDKGVPGGKQLDTGDTDFADEKCLEGLTQEDQSLNGPESVAENVTNLDEPEEEGSDENVESEVAELKDKLLRALAEIENVRRRAERDRQDAARYATTSFAREMLAVTDNLCRALDAVSQEKRSGNEDLDALVSGVELTQRGMFSAFEREGIKPIEALDKQFDHNLHEAVFEIAEPTKVPGTVIQIIEKGYMLNDRLLRPVKVGTARAEMEVIPEKSSDVDVMPQNTDEETSPNQDANTTSQAYKKQGETRTKKKSSGSKVDESL